jgi:hypothetical protein
MLPVMGYAVKAPLKRGVEVAMRTSNNANPIEDVVYNMHKASLKSMLEYCLIYQLVWVTIPMLLKHILDFRKQLKVMI